MGLFVSAGSDLIRNRSSSSLSLPRWPHLGGCPCRTSMGAYLRECFLHRLSRRAGLQIIHYRDQCPHDVFDFFSCHVGLTLG